MIYRTTGNQETTVNVNYKDTILDILVNLFFFFSLIPYVSVLPFKSGIFKADLQPLFILFGIVALVYIGLYKKYKYDLFDLFFLSFAFLFLIYINIFDVDFVIKKRITLLVAFLVFYITRRLHFRFNHLVFGCAVLVNFLAAIFHRVDPIRFKMIAEHILRDVKIIDFSGSRGVSGLAPEPGFLGGMGVFFLLLLVYFSHRQKLHPIYILSISAMSLIIILMTKSGTGYMFLFVFFIIFYLTTFFKINLFNVSFLGVSTLILAYLSIQVELSNIVVNQHTMKDAGRGVYVLYALYSNPIQYLLDLSIAHRLLNIVISFLSLLIYPFGAGAGSFSEVSKEIFARYELIEIFPAVADRVTGLVSSFSMFLVEMGVLAVGFILVVFLDTKYTLTSLQFRSIAILFLIASFSLAFPPIWILLAISHRSNMWIFGTKYKNLKQNSDSKISFI